MNNKQSLPSKEIKNNPKPYQFSFTEAKEGYTEIASSENAPLNRLSVGRIRISKEYGQYSSNTKNNEVLLTVLIGQCNIEVANTLGEKTFLNIGKRNDIFADLPEALLLGPNTKYTIIPVSKTVDIVTSQVDIEGETYEAVLLKQEDVDIRDIGEAHFKRKVRVLLGGESKSKELRAGETINDVGNWSSWPHHSFDVHRELYPKFEEVFLYFVKPKESYGVQRIDGIFCNGESVDSAFEIKNGDWAVMPLGNHPVASGPDSQVFYYWAYISPIPKIYSKWAEDQGGYA